MCLFIIDWNVRLTKTAGLCYSKRERKYNVETRTARIELSTKVNFLCNFLFKLVPGDRFCRQTERHSYPRNVPRRFLGGLGLQVAFVFLFNCSIEFTQSSNCLRHLSCLQRWAWTPLAPLGWAGHEKVMTCVFPVFLWLPCNSLASQVPWIACDRPMPYLRHPHQVQLQVRQLWIHHWSVPHPSDWNRNQSLEFRKYRSLLLIIHFSITWCRAAQQEFGHNSQGVRSLPWQVELILNHFHSF